jgi:hypothetical protein
MKLPRRNFLHLAARAVALAAVSRADTCALWCRFHPVGAATRSPARWRNRLSEIWASRS